MIEVNYIYVLVLTCLVNIPFGYLRGNTRKFSILWFLYIHLPVPLVIWFRSLFDVDLTWGFAPFYFGVYLLGQWLGTKIYARRMKVKLLAEENIDME